MNKIFVEDLEGKKVPVHLHQRDLPDGITWSNNVALDTEFTGLQIQYDYLCLVQLRLSEDGPIHIVQVSDRNFQAPNICRLLTDNKVTKVGHYILADLMYLYSAYKVMVENVWCTYIASKLGRSYSPSHSLLDNCAELLSVNISKQERATDWAVERLTDSQQKYAATDVLYLHALQSKLAEKIERKNAWPIFQAAQKIIPQQAYLNNVGCRDILERSHSKS